MATVRSDVIIPEVFTPYLIEQTTQRDAFLASGVVQPMAELNATEGGDFVNVPFLNRKCDIRIHQPRSHTTSVYPGRGSFSLQIDVLFPAYVLWFRYILNTCIMLDTCI